MSERMPVTQLLDLTGRVFLVVGGARDLGFTFATALVEAGASGVITSRKQPLSESAAAQLSRDAGRAVVGLGLDATVENQVRATVAATWERFGRIDVLVNNVGGGADSRPDSATALASREKDDWERMLATNLTAPWLVCKHVSPVMRSQQHGSIINIASIAGQIGRDRRVYPSGMNTQTHDYAAAKGGLVALTRDLAACLGVDGVRVNAISPGGIERNQPREFIDAYSRKTVLGRMGRPDDLKGTIVFLASDASAYVTGQNIVVDGGFSIWQ